MEHFSEFEQYRSLYRRQLLPWWIRFFSWVFIILGGLGIPVFLILFFNRNIDSSLFNLDVAFPSFGQHLSAILMILNGFTGLWLWLEKKDAVKIAVGCSILNIIACLVSMAMIITHGRFSLRLELIFIILFLVKLLNIKHEWENTAVSRNGVD